MIVNALRDLLRFIAICYKTLKNGLGIRSSFSLGASAFVCFADSRLRFTAQARVHKLRAAWRALPFEFLKRSPVFGRLRLSAWTSVPPATSPTWCRTLWRIGSVFDGSSWERRFQGRILPAGRCWGAEGWRFHSTLVPVHGPWQAVT